MGGKALNSRVFLWNLAPMSHFCLYNLIFFLAMKICSHHLSNTKQNVGSKPSAIVTKLSRH